MSVVRRKMASSDGWATNHADRRFTCGSPSGEPLRWWPREAALGVHHRGWLQAGPESRFGTPLRNREFLIEVLWDGWMGERTIPFLRVLLLALATGNLLTHHTQRLINHMLQGQGQD